LRRIARDPWAGPVQTCDTFPGCEELCQSGRPSKYSFPLSLLSLAVNSCDSTLGEMLIFKLVFADIKDSQQFLQTQLEPFPGTGEIAVFANFTKSTGSFPPIFFCPFNLLRMARLLHLEVPRDVTYRLETDNSIVLSDLKTGVN